MRAHNKAKPSSCWACSVAHCRIMTISEGRYAGFVGEEPEYEATAEMGPLIGLTEPNETIYLSNVVDRMGIDVNESGYMIAWLMECYEKGYLTKDDFDGIEMNWGDAEAVDTMLRKIAHREGCGDRFAEGTKRSAEQVGGEAAELLCLHHEGRVSSRPRPSRQVGWSCSTPASRTPARSRAVAISSPRPTWASSAVKTASTRWPCRP